MRAGRIIFHRLHHHFERHAQRAPHGERGHDVLGVVRPAQRALRHVEQRPLPVRQPADDQAAIQINVRRLTRRAERDDLRRHFDLQRLHPFQRLALDDGPVERLLVHEHTRHSADVIIRAGITIQMIGSEIQQHRNCGTEKFHQLELLRLHLQNQMIHFFRLLHDGTNRTRTMARRHRATMTGFENELDELSRRAFAVGSCDCERQAFREAETQFQFADHRDATRRDVAEQRGSRRHGRTHHREIKRQRRNRSDAEPHVNAVGLERTGVRLQRRRVRAVHAHHEHALMAQQTARGPAPSAEAGHQHFFICEIKHGSKLSQISAPRRSADLQSAVSPICNRQRSDSTKGSQHSERQRIANPRYGRLQTCATPSNRPRSRSRSRIPVCFEDEGRERERGRSRAFRPEFILFRVHSWLPHRSFSVLNASTAQRKHKM